MASDLPQRCKERLYAVPYGFVNLFLAGAARHCGLGDHLGLLRRFLFAGPRRLLGLGSGRADVLAAFALPPIELASTDGQSATFGLPWIGLTLGVDMGW